MKARCSSADRKIETSRDLPKAHVITDFREAVVGLVVVGGSVAIFGQMAVKDARAVHPLVKLVVRGFQCGAHLLKA